MNDVQHDSDSPQPEPPQPEPPQPEPQFGLIDIVESFTAMRHESRNQAKETRQLVETLQQTTSQLTAFEQRLLTATTRVQQVVEQISSDQELQRLAETIAEIDHNVTRAIESVQRWGGEPAATTALDGDALKHAIDERYAQMSPIARWFARSFAADLQADVEQWAGRPSEPAADTDNPIQQGLDMLLQRIRRMMAQQHIDRIDSVGLPFDGQRMHAVEAVESPTHASGLVVEQLNAAYTFRGTVIKYSDVRVAK